MAAACESAAPNRRAGTNCPPCATDAVWVLAAPAYFNRPGPRVMRGAEALAHVLQSVDVGDPVLPGEANRLSEMES
ncbi:hypothetical protein ACIPXV_12235 [Streptomyces libani]|uniref:hypothetical protein n=1 Tax=Streptomyces nigrescens TaxID=1920 RepID=UPI003830185C